MAHLELVWKASAETRTLREFCYLFWRDLSQAFLGLLDRRAEALGELVGRLTEVEARKAGLQLIPAFHVVFVVVVRGKVPSMGCDGRELQEQSVPYL